MSAANTQSAQLPEAQGGWEAPTADHAPTPATTASAAPAAGVLTREILAAPQNTPGEGHVPLTSEPEAEGAADAVRRAVRGRRERVHDPPAAIVAGQLKQHPDGPLREPASLELRQHHPADLRYRLAAVLDVGPQHDRSRHHLRRGLAGDDHLDPLSARRSRLDIAGDLILNALAGKRATQLGCHSRVAPHPHIGADIAQLNIPQPHRRSSSTRASAPLRSPSRMSSIIYGHTDETAPQAGGSQRSRLRAVAVPAGNGATPAARGGHVRDVKQQVTVQVDLQVVGKIDEAHGYKNMHTASNIADAAIDGSMRASDLDMKIDYLQERNGQRVVTFATATPIANSVTEAFVMQHYLRPDLLHAARNRGLRHLGRHVRADRHPDRDGPRRRQQLPAEDPLRQVHQRAGDAPDVACIRGHQDRRRPSPAYSRPGQAGGR